MCLKKRLWKGFVRAKDFRLLQGEDALADYQFAGREIHHRFCRKCGTQPFASSSLEQLGADFYAINISCLDDATEDELARAPITYEDGHHDDWNHPPAVTKHL